LQIGCARQGDSRIRFNRHVAKPEGRFKRFVHLPPVFRIADPR
jgi:hypothetical protein